VAARQRCGGAWCCREKVVAAHDVAEVEPVRPDNKLSGGEVEPRDAVTGLTVRASATDRREVERRDGASGCTA
jgi:hypothetical protein